MTEITKYGWWVREAGWPREDPAEEPRKAEPDAPNVKTVMVYRLDKETRAKEPLGILVERRKEERGDNVVGLVRLARKEFSETESDSSRITIGDYI